MKDASRQWLAASVSASTGHHHICPGGQYIASKRTTKQLSLNVKISRVLLNVWSLKSLSCDDLKLAIWAVFQFVNHEVQCHESSELNPSAPPLLTQLIMRHPQTRKTIQSTIQTEKQQQKKKQLKANDLRQLVINKWNVSEKALIMCCLMFTFSWYNLMLSFVSYTCTL